MGSEVLQFVGALVLFAAILVGSYWFVYLPTHRKNRSSGDREG